MRISDWSSDVCSSDLTPPTPRDVGITPKAVGDVTPTYADVAGASGGAVGRGYAPDAPRGKQKRTVACATVRKWPGGPGRQAVAMGEIGRAACRERGSKYV